MHSNLFKVCEILKESGIKLTLLSTGLLLKKEASQVSQWIDEVIVSLDGSRPVHNLIRNIPLAYEKLEEGIAALKFLNQGLPIRARCVLQKQNYRDLPNILEAAKALKLDQISFLAADVSSTAFNRSMSWENEKIETIALSPVEVEELSEIMESVIKNCRRDFKTGFIAEKPAKLRQLVAYYKATAGQGEFPRVKCNAPWVSAVIESDGQVQPCFFHPEQGNIRDKSLDQILNSPEAIDFRRKLEVDKNPICRKCVCSLDLSPWAKV